MISSFYNAKSGAIANEKAISVVANNFSNIGTVGFKGDRMTFSETLYTNIHEREEEMSNIRNGHGAINQQVSVLFEQGALQNTNEPLDFALLGEGFFALESPEGETLYTRDGHFQISNQDGTFYLTDPQGNLVLNSESYPIIVEENLDSIALEELNIGVFNFNNKFGLMKLGDNKFAATLASQEGFLNEQAVLKQGYIESSNVDTATEMARVIEFQRGFQFNARIIQLSDELEQTINNLR